MYCSKTSGRYVRQSLIIEKGEKAFIGFFGHEISFSPLRIIHIRREDKETFKPSVKLVINKI